MITKSKLRLFFFSFIIAVLFFIGMNPKQSYADSTDPYLYYITPLYYGDNFWQPTDQTFRLYRISKDGKSRQQLSSGMVLKYQVVGDWIYYFSASFLNRSDNDHQYGEIYRMKKDGSSIQRIDLGQDAYGSAKNAVDFTVAGDWIYYIDDTYKSHKIWRIKPDGSGNSAVSQGSAAALTMLNNRIYYARWYEGKGLYSMKLDGSEVRAECPEDVIASHERDIEDIMSRGSWLGYQTYTNFLLYNPSTGSRVNVSEGEGYDYSDKTIVYTQLVGEYNGVYVLIHQNDKHNIVVYPPGSSEPQTVVSDDCTMAQIDGSTLYYITASDNKLHAKALAQLGINVVYNGTPLTFDTPPVIKDDRLLVPIRAIAEAMGAQVTWNQSTQTVGLVLGSTSVNLTIGQSTAYVSGQETQLDVPAQIIEGRTMVPLRFISEGLGATVEWDEATSTAYITYVPMKANYIRIMGVTDGDQLSLSQVKLTAQVNNSSIKNVNYFLGRTGTNTTSYIGTGDPSKQYQYIFKPGEYANGTYLLSCIGIDSKKKELAYSDRIEININVPLKIQSVSPSSINYDGTKAATAEITGSGFVCDNGSSKVNVVTLVPAAGGSNISAIVKSAAPDKITVEVPASAKPVVYNVWVKNSTKSLWDNKDGAFAIKPVIKLTGPANGKTLKLGTSITLAGTAKGLDEVAFFVKKPGAASYVQLGSSMSGTTGSYTYTWVTDQTMLQGTYSLTIGGKINGNTVYGNAVETTLDLDFAEKVKAKIEGLIASGQAQVIYRPTIDGSQYSVVKIFENYLNINLDLVKVDGLASQFTGHSYYFLDKSGYLVTDPDVISKLQLMQNANYRYTNIENARRIQGYDRLQTDKETIQDVINTRIQYDVVKFFGIDLTKKLASSAFLLYIGDTKASIENLGELATDAAKNPVTYIHPIFMGSFYNSLDSIVKLQGIHARYVTNGYINSLEDAREYLKATALAAAFSPNMNFDGKLTGSLGEAPKWYDWFGDTFEEVVLSSSKSAQFIDKFDDYATQIAIAGMFYEQVKETGDVYLSIQKALEVMDDTEYWYKQISYIRNQLVKEYSADYRETYTYQIMHGVNGGEAKSTI